MYRNSQESIPYSRSADFRAPTTKGKCRIRTPARAVWLLPPMIAVLVLCFPEISFRGIDEGLSMCAGSVIPALFPFLVLSPLLTDALSSAAVPEQNENSKTSCKRALETAFFIGMIGGFPVGAVTLLRFYQNRILDRETTAAFLGICSASSPAFLSGYVGKILFHSAALGWLLYGMQTIFSFLMFRYQLKKIPLRAIAGADVPNGKPSEAAPKRFFVSLTAALRSGSEGILMLCGTVVFFSVLRAFLCAFLPTMPAAVCSGFLEITGGVRALALLSDSGGLPFPCAWILCCATVGFGGLCVGMQTASFAQPMEISMKPYWFVKLLLCTFCTLTSALIMLASGMLR